MDITLLDGIDNLEEWIEGLSRSEKKQVLTYLSQVEDYKANNKMMFFKPDTWQEKAIARGKTEKFRAVIAGNR